MAGGQICSFRPGGRSERCPWAKTQLAAGRRLRTDRVGYTLFAATRSCGAPVRAFPGMTTMWVTLPSLKAFRKRG